MAAKAAFCAGLLSLVLFAAPAGSTEQPGTVFHVKASELPKPFATPAIENSSQTIPRPAGALPIVPKGFSVSVFASGLSDARWMALAPNGDVFLSEPDKDRVMLLHDGKASVFAAGFDKPHGLSVASPFVVITLPFRTLRASP